MPVDYLCDWCGAKCNDYRIVPTNVHYYIYGSKVTDDIPINGYEVPITTHFYCRPECVKSGLEHSIEEHDFRGNK